MNEQWCLIACLYSNLPRPLDCFHAATDVHRPVSSVAPPRTEAAGPFSRRPDVAYPPCWTCALPPPPPPQQRRRCGRLPHLPPPRRPGQLAMTSWVLARHRPFAHPPRAGEQRAAAGAGSVSADGCLAAGGGAPPRNPPAARHKRTPPPPPGAPPPLWCRPHRRPRAVTHCRLGWSRRGFARPPRRGRPPVVARGLGPGMHWRRAHRRCHQRRPPAVGR